MPKPPALRRPRLLGARLPFLLVALALPSVLPPLARAQTLFWDANGSTSGSSADTTAPGAWDASTANWSDASDGTAATQAWSGGATAVFSAGANATGTFTITAAGTLSTGGLTFEEGNVTVSGGELAGSSAIDVASGASATIGSVISGGQALAKTGSGTLVLSGANTYSGGTTVSAGTLQLGNGGAAGSVTGDITNNGTIIFNRSDDFYFTGAISGTGSVTHDGYILRFTQAQTYTGPTLIRGYALVLATTVDQGLSAATTVDVGAGAVFDFSNRSLEIAGLSGPGRVYSYGGNSGHLTVNTSAETSFEFSGVLGGDSAYDFALTKTGAGTQILSGANTYTGTTTINGGTLRATGPGALGATSAITVNNAGTTLAINYGGASDYTEAEATALLAKTTFGATTTVLAFDTTNASNPVTYGDALAMNAGFTKLGPGTLVLTGNNTYTGATSISAGTLQIGDGGEEGALPTGTAITNNGTLVFDLSIPTALSDITGSGAVTQQGRGTLTLSGTNTYTGATLISAGTLQIGDGGTTGSLSPDSAIVINGTLAFNRSDLVTQGVDFANTLTGGGQLAQQGGGTLLLLGTNTLGGGAVVNSGTMQLGNGTDAATLQGGVGANGASGVAGDPNMGVDPARNGGAGSDGGSAFVVNSGGTLDLSAQTTIAGGAGGQGGNGWGIISASPTQPGSGGNAGAGGNAVVVNGGTLASLPSQSTIIGGAGGSGGFGGNWSSDSGPLAPPVFAQGGGAGTGGTGVLFLSASSWTSSGTLIGGAGGNSGEGADFLPGGGGGAGVVFREGGSLDNLGTISGGIGGLPGLQRSSVAGDIGKQAGYGGAGVAFLANGSLSNSGAISGGLGGNGNLGGGFIGLGPGGDGGLGVAFAAGGSLTNSGVINGGHGGDGGDTAGGGALFGIVGAGSGATGGNGGSGVAFTASGSFTNSGAISGGSGGDGGDGFFYTGFKGTAGSDGGKGGDGGSGVTFAAGGSLTNSGTISGGLGGVGGLGGTRGDPGEDNGADGANGSAGAGVAFAGAAGTLTNQSGGVINGGVVMGHFANDVTLETGSTVNGDLDLDTDTGSTLTLTGGGSATYSQAVTGVTTFAGSLIKNGSGTWTLDQAFTHTGGTLVRAGTLNLANTSGSALGTGGVTVESGAFLTGTGSFTGALTLDAGGTLAPGDSPGLMTIGSGSVFNGTVALQIGGLIRGTDYDAIDVGGAGALTFGGTLDLSLINGFDPTSGDSFDLFDFTTGAGAFDTLDLPALTAGLTWDTSNLYTTGTLTIGTSAIPEPATVALALGLCALTAALIRRRRARSEPRGDSGFKNTAATS